jgi:DNA-binding CsgD family transcriptional regulator/tetratricopeptide (TPR) repeat protein
MSIAKEPDALHLKQVMQAAYTAEGPAEYLRVWEQAHLDLLARGNVEGAARCAVWLGMALLDRAEYARGGGWIARARRLLEDGHPDCVEQGYLLMPAAIQAMEQGRFEDGMAISEQGIEIGKRFDDPDLVIMLRHGQGRVRIRAGQCAEGLALLDEVMVAVTSRETSPLVTGIVYCSVIDACNEVFDSRRMQEWTEALNAWLQSQPEHVQFGSRCLLHRVQIHQLHGRWPDAMQEARRACDLLSMPPPHPLAGEAHYRQGELHRMRGQVREAEKAYAGASASGREPQPGLALLRLAEGRTEAAAAMIRPVIEDARDRPERARILDAYVEILLAAGDIPAARDAAEDLKRMAADLDSPYLRGVAGRALGSALLAEGETKAAGSVLREARSRWSELDAPYESARVRLLLGLVYRELGDEDSAAMEIEAARQTFERLDAAPDLARLEELDRAGEARPAGGLSGREVQVLALVATGMTNREIATALSISEKTVARHVSNIFTKLDVPTRAAATAYAFKHALA